MGFLDGVDTNEIEGKETDSLGGFGPMESGLYDGVFKYAYFGNSAKGATSITFVLTLEGDKEHKEVIWIVGKTGNPTFGYNIANGAAMLSAGMKLKDMQTTTKTIKLYDYDAKKEVPTEVEMLMDFIGKPTTVAIIKRIENKTKKDDATGEYEPINEERVLNVVSKFFRKSDGMTVTELRAKATTPEFKEKWEEKWKGVVDNRYKEVAGNGTIGTPQKSGSQVPVDDLFAD